MSEKKPELERISAIAPFGLRMLPRLREKVEEAAGANGRSMNSEIIARLEASFSLDSIASQDLANINLREMIWKAMQRHLHQYRNGVLDDVDRMLIGKQLRDSIPEDPEGAN